MRGAGVVPNQQLCMAVARDSARRWPRSGCRAPESPGPQYGAGSPLSNAARKLWAAAHIFPWRIRSGGARRLAMAAHVSVSPQGAPCHRAGTREHARVRAADQGRSPACTATPAAPGRNAEHARLDRVRQGNSAARAADQGHAGVGAHGAVVGARRRRRRTVRPQPVDAPFGSGRRQPSRGVGLRRVTPGTRPRPVAGSPGQR